MKILVSFALENEFAPWRSIRRFRREACGSGEVHVSEFPGIEICVYLTGAGPRLARMRTSEVISAIPGTIACCISTGLAGSLKPEYEIGQVLASRTVFSEEAPEDFPGGVLAGSPALISFAEMYGAKVVDRFHSTARVITRANEKLYLGRSADAVEMESFEVLRGAAASGIPAVAIRSISDLAGEDLPLDTVEIFNDRGQVSYPRVIGQIARHPNKVSGFMRLGQQSKLAAESLARFLDSYVLGLAEKASLLDFNAEGAMRAAQP